MSHLNALSDRFLERVIPKDGLSSNVLDGPNGRSFWLLMIYLSSFCPKKNGLCVVHEIPKDDLS